MSATFENLRVLQIAEEIADSVWKGVVKWDEFAKDVVGKQIARAADSIGANISESFGRFHFGEKLQFLYYARGSIFETKYWLNRVKARGLMEDAEVQAYIEQVANLARNLNIFVNSLKNVRNQETKKTKALREMAAEYQIALPESSSDNFFDDDDLAWLQS